MVKKQGCGNFFSDLLRYALTDDPEVKFEVLEGKKEAVKE